MRKATVWVTAMFLCNAVSGRAQEHSVLPQVIVYKTKGNYKDLVPVTLSDDGASIVSYPAIEDIKAGLNTLKPTKLAKGYWLDNSGRIGRHVAFLNITYDEYSKLDKGPLLTELYAKLKDKAPLEALYDCGTRNGTSTPQQLKKMIRKRKLESSCKKID